VPASKPGAENGHNNLCIALQNLRGHSAAKKAHLFLTYLTTVLQPLWVFPIFWLSPYQKAVFLQQLWQQFKGNVSTAG
jgi:hypothetical protein